MKWQLEQRLLRRWIEVLAQRHWLDLGQHILPTNQTMSAVFDLGPDAWRFYRLGIW